MRSICRRSTARFLRFCQNLVQKGFSYGTHAVGHDTRLVGPRSTPYISIPMGGEAGGGQDKSKTNSGTRKRQGRFELFWGNGRPSPSLKRRAGRWYYNTACWYSQKSSASVCTVYRTSNRGNKPPTTVYLCMYTHQKRTPTPPALPFLRMSYSHPRQGRKGSAGDAPVLAREQGRRA